MSTATTTTTTTTTTGTTIKTTKTTSLTSLGTSTAHSSKATAPVAALPTVPIPHSTVSLTKFGGSTLENWVDFESLFRSIIDVTGVARPQQVGYLKLHLKDSALQFFHTFDASTKADVDLTLQALKNHFCNPKLRKLHQLKLESLKFKHKEEQPEEFLVKLQNLALHAFPDPTERSPVSFP